MSLLIGDNLVVSMHYTLTDDDGQTLDSSEGHEPMAYLHGARNIIPGLEKAMIGKTVEDTFKVSIEPAEAYGEIVPELIQTVDRAAFQGVDQIEVGMAFDAQGDDGLAQRIIVKQVDGDQITVDANHELAGQTLHFEVKVVAIREATQEELDHGHVH